MKQVTRATAMTVISVVSSYSFHVLLNIHNFATWSLK